jgi:dynein heavy chain
MKKLIEEINEFKPHSDYIFREPILFGDYRNALEMGEPRIYEDLQDYDAAKALFEQVKNFFNILKLVLIKLLLLQDFT